MEIYPRDTNICGIGRCIIGLLRRIEVVIHAKSTFRVESWRKHMIVVARCIEGVVVTRPPLKSIGAAWPPCLPKCRVLYRCDMLKAVPI